MKNLLNIDPSSVIQDFLKQGYALAKGGVSTSFLESALSQAEDHVDRGNKMDEWNFKNKKQQYLYEFESTAALDNIKDDLAAATGMNRAKFTLCERHIKVYDDTAPVNPPAHKDRQASQLTVGVPLKVPANSQIILWPNDHLDINYWSSTAAYRDGQKGSELPENLLKDIEPVYLDAQPGDLVMFRGNQIYHERVNPANTWLLYLKFNELNLDPIGEDPITSTRRNNTLEKFNGISDDGLMNQMLDLSPKLDQVYQYFSRIQWTSRYRVKIWGEHEFDIIESDFQILKNINGTKTTREVLECLSFLDNTTINQLQSVRRMIQLGAIDLIGEPTSNK